MNDRRRMKLNHQISEEAAEWFVAFRSGDIDKEGRHAFDSWVRASPEHLRAFIETAALWRESGSLDPERRISIEDLIARAKFESNVVALEQGAQHDGRPQERIDRQVSRAYSAEHAGPAARRWPRSVTQLATAAVILIGLLGAGFLAWTHFSGERLYSTEVGERRSVRLPDGSMVTLDSRSRLRVAFTDRARAMDLLEGRALFEVAKDPSKPFIVHADGTTIQALGTQFDVDRTQISTVVTVVEGRVAVQQPVERVLSNRSHQPTQPDVHADATPVFLSAGEQLKIVGDHGSAEPAHTNVSSATAWTHGQLILESATLADVAEEFNRYSPRKLVAEDHGATALRLSGVFATDPDFLIRYLRNRRDIVVHETDGEIRIVRKAVD
jgi:transmembrane sensor